MAVIVAVANSVLVFVQVMVFGFSLTLFRRKVGDTLLASPRPVGETGGLLVFELRGLTGLDLSVSLNGVRPISVKRGGGDVI